METVQFLGDIDDDKIYAAKLELAYNCVYQEVVKILIDMENVCDIDLLDFGTKRQLQQLLRVILLQIRQMAERKRRLADIAVGLTDRVLDEQST